MQLVTILLAAAPALVVAKGTLGFAIGNQNVDGSCKLQADWKKDFDALNGTVKVVRTYSASNCNTAKELLPAAKADGMQVILGVWPDYEDSYKKDKDAIVKYAALFPDQIYGITVGSETMYRGNFTGEELLPKLLDIKKATGGKFKVGTADSWNKFQDGTADALITGGADFLLCNAFSYWQGQAANNASAMFFDSIMQAFSHIQAVSGSTDKVELWVGETGWPSDGGSTYGNAVAGTKIAAAFWKQGICGMLDWGVNVFAFEAFDEPWKPKSIGSDGSVADETHWGAFTADRKPKYSLAC